MPRNTTRLSAQNTRKWLTTAVMLLAIVIIGTFSGLVIAAVINVPDWSPDKLTGSVSTTLYDKDNKPFTQLHAEENRVFVPLDKIPDNLTKAFIAMEDQQFYEHHGVNFKSIIRAVVVDLVSGSKRQGASTITQQLAKNAFLSPQKTWERKVKEMVMSFQLENRYTKDEILEFYLNRIYFGSGAWGVQTAARTYFGKDVNELNLSESAMLAGLVRSPNTYSPFRNYDLAKSRQRIVLSNMADCGFITREQADKAYVKPIHLRKAVGATNRYGYYVDYVIDEADRILIEEGLYDNPQDAIFKGGLKIYTTADTDVQEYAEDIYADPSKFPPAKSSAGQIIQSAMVLLDQHTGAILALVGGRDLEQQRGFNRAVDALRQPGSSLKPLVVYGPAVEAGYSPDYILDDKPLSYSFGGETWTPGNSDGKYRGPITMRTALQFSVNTYAVQLAEQVGIKNGIRFAEDLGITTLVKAGRYNDMNLSTALGGITRGVSPIEMASAYGSFANGGVHMQSYVIRKIMDADGNVIYEHHNKGSRVMKKETAWVMTSLLKNVVDAGTGTRAQISGVDVAGKTGTTQDSKDAWFLGFTPQYACSVWMGYDKKEAMNRQYGGMYPAMIWKAVMMKALAGAKSGSGGSFQAPDGLTQVAICEASGKLPSGACPEESIKMVFLEKDKIPTEKCDRHILIDICPDSGKRATQYCPSPVPRGFLKNAPEGDVNAPPTEYCDIHGADTPNAAEQVKICKDPRNRGIMYRANVSPDGTGGCPPEYVETVTVNNSQYLSNCPLPDHQLQ